MKYVCFTGHRKMSEEDRIYVRSALLEEVMFYASIGAEVFISGAAKGFDLLAASIVLEVRKTYPNIKLWLAIPYEGHSAHWSVSDKEEFERIRKQANLCTVISEKHEPNRFSIRNRWMVNRSQLCIAWWSGSRSGTGSTVAYAKSQSVTVVNIWREKPVEVKANMIRIGHGYDAHRLVEGRRLILGGVHIPYSKGLDGHSDADVLTHAIMDSLLGAAALGDIGKLFPPSDRKYKDADSILLLQEVFRVISKAGYSPVNIDSTIIAQAPKLAPYIQNMRQRIADALGIDISAVSVKATTEEHMGFTGRGEGISAHAVCLIEKQS